MNEEYDLKRMFDAQRAIDKELAPSLDDLNLLSQTSRISLPAAVNESRETRKPKSLRIALVVSATAVSVLLVVFALRRVPQAEKPSAGSTTPSDLRELNRVCDSLLVAIRESELATSPQSPPETGREMDWPTGTDSLMPFDTLAFYARTSP